MRQIALPDNKPDIIDWEADYLMILTQYERDYPASFFMSDYDTLPYQVFMHRLYALGGRMGDIFQQRNRLLHDPKMTADERKYARKFITPAIEEYLDYKKDKANDAYANTLLTGFRNALIGGA